MNIPIQPIQNQQYDRLVQNSTLRNAAACSGPPDLSEDESNMIRRTFDTGKPMNIYNVRGDMKEQDFGSGRKLDTRI